MSSFLSNFVQDILHTVCKMCICPVPCPPPCSRTGTQCPCTYVLELGGWPWVTALGNQTLVGLWQAKLRAAVGNHDLQQCP